MFVSTVLVAVACGGRSVTFVQPPQNAVRVYVDVGEEAGWTGLALDAFRDERECRDANAYAVGQQSGAHYRMALGDRETRF